MTTTIIEITADSSEDTSYHVTGKHLHMLQVSVYGWLAHDNGNLKRWLENLPTTIDRDTAIVYTTSDDGSYLVDEDATRANLLAAYPDAEIRWTTADEPSRQAMATEPPALIDLSVHRECDGTDCILVGGRPATASLRRLAERAWRRAGNGETPADRYVRMLMEDRVLAHEAALDPGDRSLEAEQIRGAAGSIRDHREMDTRRAEQSQRDAMHWTPTGRSHH